MKKFRPKKTLISNENDSVKAVCQMLSNKRGDASLIVFLIDTDVIPRVVFANINPSSSSVSRVITLNPTMVLIDDSAMNALSTMVENRYRHLPIVYSSHAVIGMLNIAKCLSDAVSKLERSPDKSGSATEDSFQQMVSLQGEGGSQAAMLTQLLGPLIDQTLVY